jgi:co-chaperonin GroES (HSP10)
VCFLKELRIPVYQAQNRKYPQALFYKHIMPQYTAMPIFLISVNLFTVKVQVGTAQGLYLPSKDRTEVEEVVMMAEAKRGVEEESRLHKNEVDNGNAVLEDDHTKKTVVMGVQH